MPYQKQAWVLISTIPQTAQTAAFTDHALAIKLAGYIDACREPVLMNSEDIIVPIDKYVEEVTNGKRPFSILMVDDSIFEIWGYGDGDDRVTDIHEFGAYRKGDSLYWAKTFWALDLNLAKEQAFEFWQELKLKGNFAEYPIAD